MHIAVLCSKADMQALQTWAEALADQSHGSRAPLDLLMNACQSKQTGSLRLADSFLTPSVQAAAFEQGLSITSRQADGITHDSAPQSSLLEIQAECIFVQACPQMHVDLQKLRCKPFYPCAHTSLEVKAK